MSSDITDETKPVLEDCENEFIPYTYNYIEIIGATMCIASFIFLFFVCLNVQGTLRMNEKTRNDYLLY